MPILVMSMHRDDINAVATIHSQQFPRQQSSSQWIGCNFAAFHRVQIFVARNESDEVVGYIQWIHKSGFRKEAVIELEQIAVMKNYQGKGIGTKLIKESLNFIQIFLNNDNSSLKAVLVSTRTDNQAQALYRKVLKAEEIAVIKNLYSADEVIMLARDF